MYRQSLIPRKCLITTDEVIAQGPTDASVDPRVLLGSIQIAEDRFIKPAICKALYDDFRNKKNVLVTDANIDFLQGVIDDSLAENAAPVEIKEGDIINAIELVDDEWYVTLWNEYLWKLVAECVVYTATPVNYSRFTSSGEMQNAPKTVAAMGDGKGANSVELKEVQWKLDQLHMSRIDPIIAAMQEWICDNIEHFPKYNCRECACAADTNGVSVSRKTAWIHGLYDTNKETCCD